MAIRPSSCYAGDAPPITDAHIAALEADDFVVFVPKSYTDAHPGGECAIAGSLSTTGLHENPNAMNNGDHGGYVLVDGAGRLYVDVLLHTLLRRCCGCTLQLAATYWPAQPTALTYNAYS